MTELIKQADLYKEGLCMCLAAMKGKHIKYNTHDPSKTFSIYMCTKCNKPVYWQSMPYR